MLKNAGVALIFLVALAALAIALIVRRTPPPDSQAFVNGTVLTMNAGNDTAEAIFVAGDRIVAVGSQAKIQALVDSDTVVHDLDGKTMIPGSSTHTDTSPARAW